MVFSPRRRREPLSQLKNRHEAKRHPLTLGGQRRKTGEPDKDRRVKPGIRKAVSPARRKSGRLIGFPLCLSPNSQAVHAGGHARYSQIGRTQSEQTARSQADLLADSDDDVIVQHQTKDLAARLDFLGHRDVGA